MFIEEYKGYRINKDMMVKQDKYYSVVNNKVLYGGDIGILKRKIDRLIEVKK